MKLDLTNESFLGAYFELGLIEYKVAKKIIAGIRKNQMTSENNVVQTKVGI